MMLRSGIFFFQGEDGIRDVAVTGVQTCALPISARRRRHRVRRHARRLRRAARGDEAPDRKSVVSGKSVDLGGRRIIKKKKRESMGFWRSSIHAPPEQRVRHLGSGVM